MDGRCDKMPWMTGKPEIICLRIGVDLGVGEELSISLATKITNSDGCRVCGSDGQRTNFGCGGSI
jgi:hypothetical protein